MELNELNESVDKAPTLVDELRANNNLTARLLDAISHLGGAATQRGIAAPESHQRHSLLFTSNTSLYNPIHKRNQTEISVKFAFLTINEIKTKEQTFQAEILLQLKWQEDRLREIDEEDWEAFLQSPDFWDPRVKIFNTEQVNVCREYKCITSENGGIYIVLRRKIKAMFQVEMDLRLFPFDIQHLHVTLYSERHREECILTEDTDEVSYVNTQNAHFNFCEWQVFGHVEVNEGNPFTSTSTAPDSIQAANKRKSKEGASISTMNSMITGTCLAERRPGFYKYNVLLSMLMMVVMATAAFAISPDGPQYRMQTTVTLLLTAFTFRNLASSHLPIIGYFTLIDLYLNVQTLYLATVVLIIAALAIVERVDFYLQPIEATLISSLVTFQIVLHSIAFLYYGQKIRDIKGKILLEEEMYGKKVASMATCHRRRLSTATQAVHQSWLDYKRKKVLQEANNRAPWEQSKEMNGEDVPKIEVSFVE